MIYFAKKISHSFSLLQNTKLMALHVAEDISPVDQ